MEALGKRTPRIRLACAVIALVAFLLVPSVVAGAEEQSSRAWSGGTTTPQVAPDSFSAQGSTLRMLGGLFFCIGIFGFGVHLFKRYGLPRAGVDKRRLHIIERVSLTAKSSLLLVKLDGREFLLTAGAEQSRLISLPREEVGVFTEDLDEACGDLGALNAQ